MKKSSLIEQIDKKIKEKSILKHAFYTDWKTGKLNKTMLREYAKQYYKHVAAFPQYLSSLHCKIENLDDRKLILQNLMDEENGDRNHIELWLSFGKALGLSKEEIMNASATKETKSFVNHFKSVTKEKSIAEGVAALYAYESQIPAVSEEKIKGLVNFYGVNTQQGLEYFEVHKIADIEHSGAEKKLIEKYAVDEDTKAKVLQAVDRALDAYWSMLTGVQNLSKQCS